MRYVTGGTGVKQLPDEEDNKWAVDRYHSTQVRILGKTGNGWDGSEVNQVKD